MNYKIFFAFTFTVLLEVWAQDKSVSVPLKEISKNSTLFGLRQRYAECNATDFGPNLPLFIKATYEMMTNVQKTVDRLTEEYRVYKVPIGFGFGAWDYVFSANFYYFISKKDENRDKNQREYAEYKRRTTEFNRIATEAINREFRLTIVRLRQPIPVFRPIPSGLAVEPVSCPSLGVILTLVEAARPLLDTQTLILRFLKNFKEEWGVE